MTGNVPRGRIRRTMPVAGFTARAAGGRMVAALREKAGNTGAVERFHERTAEQYAELLGHSKGVLMKARGIDEDAAYHAMRKLAMERGQTMAKVARDVIDMARVLL